MQSMTAEGIVTYAENIGVNVGGKTKQSQINEELMNGKIYKNGKWQENVSESQDLEEATTTTLGGIRVANVRTGEVDAESGGTSALDRYYGVELDKNGKAFVYVPWEKAATPVAGASLGLVREGENTGIVIDENGVVKADFDTEDYSKVEDISAYDFSDKKAKVASPYVVNEILKKAIYDVLKTPI